jgi:hypothetical protein
MWNLFDIPKQSEPEVLEKEASATEEPNEIFDQEEDLDIFTDTTKLDDIFD